MDEPHFSSEFLQKYEIHGKVGEGGMGMVYKAVHKSLERSTAIKVIHASSFDDEKAIANFLGEAQLCAKLSHPNIVKVYEASIEGGNPYIAFEYIEGITLAQKIRDAGTLPMKEAIEICIQVLAGLSMAHEYGVVHRDIKPENILIDTEEDQAKIADFGIAKPSSAKARKSKDWVLVGTPAYMSPEQAWGDEATERSDLYSAAAVLFEMLAGQPPFTGNTMQLVSQKMNSDAPSVKNFRPEVPDRFCEILEGGLTRQPEDRYDDAEWFANKLKKAKSFLDKWIAEDRGERPRSRAMSVARMSTSSMTQVPPEASNPSTPATPPPTLAENIARMIQPALNREWWATHGILVLCVILAVGMLGAFMIVILRSLAQG